MGDFKWRDMYIGYLNLDIRQDRRDLVEAEFSKAGLTAERTKGKLPHEFDLTDPKFQVQVNRTPGSIGCWHGQIEIMQKAYQQGKSVMVFEDDIILSSDIQNRFDYIQNYINENDLQFDFFWLGGTIHINPHFWWTGVNPDLPGTENLGRDAEYIGDKHIFRSYGSFSTHAYWVRYESIPKVIEMLGSVEHLAMGIDWAAIKLAPQMNNYVFLPGSVIQRDNQSNIGNGMTIFSGFSRLGSHWFSDLVENFNSDEYNWAETKK